MTDQFLALITATLVGWAVVIVAILFNSALFAGSLRFASSGQSFEQFRRIE